MLRVPAGPPSPGLQLLHQSHRPPARVDNNTPPCVVLLDDQELPVAPAPVLRPLRSRPDAASRALERRAPPSSQTRIPASITDWTLCPWQFHYVHFFFSPISAARYRGTLSLADAVAPLAESSAAQSVCSFGRSVRGPLHRSTTRSCLIQRRLAEVCSSSQARVQLPPGLTAICCSLMTAPHLLLGTSTPSTEH